MIQQTIDKINSELKGYHVEISLYPAGGSIDVTGCDECNTKDDYWESARWSIKHKNKTIDDAISELKAKLINIDK